MSRKVSLAVGQTARTACARGLLRTGVDEKSGELLTVSVPAERVGRAARLVAATVTELLADRWNAVDVDVPDSGEWAVCPTCSWQGDRDQGAWQRIAARGLAHQTKTVADRATDAMAIRTVVDRLEAGAVIAPTAPKTSRDRSKAGPTGHKSTRPTPGRRRAPSPAKPFGRVGKRPEGHAHTHRGRLPRAAHRHQGVTTISTPATSRHRPRGAALGAGFHLHAHATPPWWERIPEPDAMSDTGSPS